MTTPEIINSLKDNQIFVFGSNLNGSHSGGAAKTAFDKFEAEIGVGEGLTGKSYAFPTLDKKMNKVKYANILLSIEKLYQCAKDNLDKQFLVTKVGCGIAGFTEEEIKEAFKSKESIKPNNIVLPKGWSIVYGYKAFNVGLLCRGFQYEVDKDFHHEGRIELCKKGFHFCKSLSDVYSYYPYGTAIMVGRVETEGDVIDQEDGEKSVTNHLKITYILNAEEAANNSGHSNNGHSNKGNLNVGDLNVGDRNVGNLNVGNLNVGNLNVGDRNVGNLNVGNLNVGDRNVGNLNVGDRNVGNLNVGDRNVGNLNVGNRNVGDRNVGNLNVGDRNVGDLNVGDLNVGDWNLTNYNTGSFNSQDHDIIVFDKPCKRGVWERASKPNLIYFNLTEWIDFNYMTDEEKEKYPNYKTQGGYLRKYDYKEAFQKSYSNASDYDKELLKALPNFDAEVFFKISGIKID